MLTRAVVTMQDELLDVTSTVQKTAIRNELRLTKATLKDLWEDYQEFQTKAWMQDRKRELKRRQSTK